jgi:hypothetical protein
MSIVEKQNRSGIPPTAEAVGLLPKKNHEFVRRANLLWNNKYDYTNTIVNGLRRRLIVCCPEHGEFDVKGYDHLNHTECPQCSLQFSKIEKEWLDYLRIPIELRQKMLPVILNKRNIKVDAFDPNTNIVYEFYGDYWHGNPNKYPPEKINLRTRNKTMKELYDNTMKREEILKNAGYKLITIWESDWKKIKKDKNQ